jgi:phenylacetate-CoA ligase
MAASSAYGFAAGFQSDKFDKAKALVAHAFAHSPAFAARLARAGLTPADVVDPQDFAAIPVVRKKELLGLQGAGDRLGGLLTVDMGRLRRIYQSPGPLFDPEARQDDYWGWTEAFRAAGFTAGDLVQMTFSYHLTPAGLMLEEPLHMLGCAVIPAGPGHSATQIELMTKLPVTAFVGMTSFLKIIGEKARSDGYDLRRDFNLRVGFVAAERLSESLRREVEDMFAMVIRQGYGTADVGCIAYECPELGGMHLTSRGLVEICDPATGAPVAPGEVGEVVFTPFSRAYPLIRLATGDLSRLSATACPCGRLAPKLAGILGRVDDTAKVKGQFIYPAQAAEVLAEFPAIRAWQLVVENPGGRDRLGLRLDAGQPCDQAALAEAFAARCKLRPAVIFCNPDEIPEGSPKLVDKRVFD